MGTLSDRVMATMPDSFEESDDYYRGFAMGTAKSSTIAKEADELMVEMATVIDSIIGECALKALDDVLNSEPCHEACELLERYNEFKERTK